MTFNSDTLKEVREKRGLSLSEVARNVGVAKSTLHAWESGKIENMGRSHIPELARVLNVNPLWILGLVDDPNPTAYDIDTSDAVKSIYKNIDVLKELDEQDSKALSALIETYLTHLKS